MQPEAPVRLLIVDDHELVRDGIRARLESEQSLEIIGEAENGNIKVIANGNRLLNSIEINNDFLKSTTKEQLEELILTAANRALEQAERVEKSEMSHAAMGILPGLG